MDAVLHRKRPEFIDPFRKPPDAAGQEPQGRDADFCIIAQNALEIRRAHDGDARRPQRFDAG